MAEASGSGCALPGLLLCTLRQVFSKCSSEQGQGATFLTFQRKPRLAGRHSLLEISPRGFNFACSGNHLVKQRAPLPQATIWKGKQRALLSSPDRKAAAPAERRGVGSQMDKGVYTAALTQVSSLTRGLHRLFCSVLDLFVCQSASQIDNFPSRHNTAKE